MDSINEYLYPHIFDNLDKILPNGGWKRSGIKWVSCYRLNGSKDYQPDRCCWKKGYPTIHENGGGNITPIKIYMEDNGVTRWEAIKAICGICGISVPKLNNQEEYKKYCEEQEKSEDRCRRMAAALHASEGAEALRYLKTVRGYDDDFISFAQMGVLTADVLAELRKEHEDKQKGKAPGDRRGFPPLSANNWVSFPYTSNGDIIGFVFRAIRPDAKPKYLDYFFSDSKTKGSCPFMLAYPSGKDAVKEAVVVEGELDTLVCLYKGVENVIGISGSGAMDKALEAIAHKGYRSVTVFLDREENEEKQGDIRLKVEKLIQAVKAAGMRPYVATFPDGDGKEDPDSFLKSHPADDLKRIIAEAVPGSAFMYEGIEKAFAAKRNADGRLSHRDSDEYRRQVIRLANDPRIIDRSNETERDGILSDFAGKNGIALESLRAEADAARGRGHDDNELAKSIREQKRQDSGAERASEHDYQDLLKIPTREERLEGFKNRADDIETKYILLHAPDGDCRMPLTIPTGALTMVASPSGHGKSTLLRNLAIDVADKMPGKTVLYFSFEECEEHLLVQFVNAYAGLELCSNGKLQQKVIENYYKNGAPDYLMVDGVKESGDTVKKFCEKEKEFVSTYLDTGRLRLFYRDYDLDTFREALEFALKSIPDIAAIFVDYLQILRAGSGDTRSRTEQLKEACIYLKNISVSNKLPIVLASQLNREARCAEEMHYNQMAESSDIEKAANTIILLWDSLHKPALSKAELKKYLVDDWDEKKPMESREIPGFVYKKKGKLYATIGKHRGGGGVGTYALLDFQGCAGRINPEVEIDSERDFRNGTRTSESGEPSGGFLLKKSK